MSNLKSNLTYLKNQRILVTYRSGKTPDERGYDVLIGENVHRLSEEDMDVPFHQLTSDLFDRVRASMREEVRRLRSLADLKERVIPYVTVQTLFPSPLLP